MIGQTISHYHIVEKLGEGGMGVVYRARDERLHRDVALKLLSEKLAGRADHRARILAEARAASALNHPGITTIYEVGEDREQLFIVMELVTGKTLRAMLSEGPVEVRALLRVGAQAAEALAAAHGHGVVHRDVKPENIIVQADGRVKLLDFGIAWRQAAETVTMSRLETVRAWLPDSRVAGTLAYMAPEQLRGEEADARADLFSLGVVLYEMATARPPFSGPTVTALIAQILNDAPPALAATSTVVPAELGRIVHKLLEKQPDSRYQSAREVQVDLTNLARDLDLGAAGRPLGAVTVAGKRAVAVLPFQFLTPNPEDEYLSVALADSVINQLSASRDLLVRPTSTVLRYARQAVDPLVAARELNVQIIVDGSIQKFGQRLRVHVQARHAADGTSLLSGKHDSEMADLFGLQDQIAASLARALGSRTRDEAPATPPTKNAAAYELFLRAVERLSRFTRWDIRMAIDMLENVTQLDPRFPEAWARLGDACIWMGVTFEPSPDWLRRAGQAIRRALNLDPANAAAQSSHGQLLWTPAKRFQNRAALRALRRALDLNPGHLPAQLQQSVILTHVGLLEDARKTCAGLLAAHPDDCRVLDTLGQIAFYQCDYQQAEEWFARSLAVAPANFYGTLDYPTAALYRGELDLAAERLRAAQQVTPGEPMLAALEALLWAKRGDKRKTERLLQRALQGGKALLHVHHTQHHAAAAYAVIGEPAQAVALLRKASAAGLPNYPLYRDEPHFRPLGDYPPFVKLMAGLQKEWSAYRREFSQL